MNLQADGLDRTRRSERPPPLAETETEAALAIARIPPPVIISTDPRHSLRGPGARSQAPVYQSSKPAALQKPPNYMI